MNRVIAVLSLLGCSEVNHSNIGEGGQGVSPKIEELPEGAHIEVEYGALICD